MPDAVTATKLRALSGVQPSGQLHLGNWAGAIRQFVELQDTHDVYIFIASYHAMTSVTDPAELRTHVRQVAIDYLAFGLDPAKAVLYRQQDVPEVTELAWMLGCACPVSQMQKAVAYKDKVAKGLSPNIGLFTYPILQAADILAVDPDVVPVGQDQKQNVEITRDLAQRFNHVYGEVFKLPEPRFRAHAAVLPGLDGEKMSKSLNNGIDPFMPEKQLRKTVMRIVSDSTPMEAPKDPEKDTTFQVYRALLSDDDPRTAALAERYRAGNFGYGHAKQALFELILDVFGEARSRREELMADPGEVERVLADGATRAREVVSAVTDRARAAVGL
ncbi:MAG: tryptophan--tRNA ligase [Planctomycetota bacterium]